MKRITDEIITKMYADYCRDLTFDQVGRLHGKSGCRVRELFVKRGLKLRTKTYYSLYVRDEVIAAMYKDYESGLTLAAVGRRHGNRIGSTIRELFISRGLKVRPTGNLNKKHRSNGCFEAAVPLTEKQISDLVAKATRIAVPVELKLEWRKWSLERRGEFIARLRARLSSEQDMPATPLSAGLEAFDYASPSAWEIANKTNAGLNSRYAKVSIKICSQGVIWRDQLWFWCSKVGYARGPWTPEEGRPALHHVIWKLHHGDIPDDCVISFRDGNRNNHAIENLALKTRDTVCRENQAAALFKKSREMTALLLKRQQKNTAKGNLHALKNR